MAKKLALLIFMLSNIMSYSYASVISIGDQVDLVFDLSSSLLAKPYRNLIVTMKFDRDLDDFGPSESFSAQVFDGYGVAVSNVVQIGPFVSASDGGIEFSFGGPLADFFGELSTDIAIVSLTEIVGSYSLMWVKGIFYSPSDDAVTRVNGEVVIFVNEPKYLFMYFAIMLFVVYRYKSHITRH